MNGTTYRRMIYNTARDRRDEQKRREQAAAVRAQVERKP